MGFIKRNGKNGDAVVGLDLDSGHIAAAEVHLNGSVAVKRGVVSPLRPGVLRDGEVGDPAALSQALRDLWSRHDLPKRVRLGLANQRIVVRTLDLPPLSDEKAVASAVRVEAPDHIPMPMDEAILDHRTIGMVESPQGPRTRVVIVAVRREMVDRFATAVREAGLKVEGVDLSAFAMIRALKLPAADDGALLYVNVAGLTNVAVASGEHCLFTRAAAGGMDSLVHALSERRGLTAEHSEQWLVHVGLERPVEQVEGDAEVVAAARAVLEEGVHQLADTVRNSLNFYRMQDNSTQVGRAVLTGPAAAVPGFDQALSASLKMPVERRIVAHDAAAAAGATRLAVAAGLAVEAV